MHATDPQINARLKRAEGHLSAVIRMISEGRDGMVIAQQLQAVIAALEKSKRLLIHDHIDHHLLDGALSSSPELREKLASFREITKYL